MDNPTWEEIIGALDYFMSKWPLLSSGEYGKRLAAFLKTLPEEQHENATAYILTEMHHAHLSSEIMKLQLQQYWYYIDDNIHRCIFPVISGHQLRFVADILEEEPTRQLQWLDDGYTPSSWQPVKDDQKFDIAKRKFYFRVRALSAQS